MTLNVSIWWMSWVNMIEKGLQFVRKTYIISGIGRVYNAQVR